MLMLGCMVGLLAWLLVVWHGVYVLLVELWYLLFCFLGICC